MHARTTKWRGGRQAGHTWFCHGYLPAEAMQNFSLLERFVYLEIALLSTPMYHHLLSANLSNGRKSNMLPLSEGTHASVNSWQSSCMKALLPSSFLLYSLHRPPCPISARPLSPLGKRFLAPSFPLSLSSVSATRHEYSKGRHSRLYRVAYLVIGWLQIWICVLLWEVNPGTECWIWCQQIVFRDQMGHPVHALPLSAFVDWVPFTNILCGGQSQTLIGWRAPKIIHTEMPIFFSGNWAQLLPLHCIRLIRQDFTQEMKLFLSRRDVVLTFWEIFRTTFIMNINFRGKS